MEKNMDTTLIIMAAGIGSRYGGGIKQLAKVGPDDEIIMDYSIYDAIKAGFTKVVFVIRRDLEKDFREIIGDRVSKYVKTEFVFQEKDALPEGFTCPENRTKPWGTGQAILACKDVVSEPFAVINADDFYGSKAFGILHDFLVSGAESVDGKDNICLAGYILKNTLSDNGTVSRGVCTVDGDMMLTDVNETKEIVRENGKVTGVPHGGEKKEIDENSFVSMNLWGLYPSFFEKLEKGFVDFLSGVKEGDVKSEYLLPMFIDERIKNGKAQATLLPTDDKWFGITYKEDLPAVKEAIGKLCDEGVYPKSINEALSK